MHWPASRSGRISRATACDVIFKIVTLFLLFIAVIAMFGKLRFPGAKRLSSAKCPACGRYRIGRGPCGCGRDRG